MNADPKLDSAFFRDPNFVGALAYIFTLVSGLVVLAVDRREGPRFHAMQSIFFSLAVAVVFLVLSGIPVLGRILHYPLLIAVGVVWVSLMFTALRGQRVKLPYIGDLAERQLAKDTSRR
jgi:uncharacterized membrane protein